MLFYNLRNINKTMPLNINKNIKNIRKKNKMLKKNKMKKNLKYLSFLLKYQKK